MAREYIQGKFNVKNKEKYVGDINNIIYRSSYELKFMNWCDQNKNVLKWSSEETIIPYRSPVDGKYHRYFIDFKIVVNTNSGNKTFIIEVKPGSQTIKPVYKKGRRKSTFINEAATYAVNEAKWRAATEYANDRGWTFMVFTEKELGIKH